MPASPDPNPRAERVRVLLGIVLLLATAVSVDLLLAVVYAHFPSDPLVKALAPAFPVSYKNWVMWAVFVPLVYWLARRVVAAEWSVLRRLLTTLVCGVALAFAHSTIEMWLHRAEGMHEVMTGGFFSYHFFHGLLTYSVVTTVALLAESGRAARARERRELQLHAQVSDAQLQLLRMQIQPHFLFNTLNSISALVEEDVRGGQRMLTQLSDFLRLTLASAEHRLVPLRDELRLLEAYVGIQQARFRDRLRVEYEIDAVAGAALVPNLLLQPLVENAIKHGVQPMLDGGTVRIRAFRAGEHLVVEVLDDGVGIAESPMAGPGLGLRNTRERLLQSYGGAAELEIVRRSPRGTAVIQRIPWSTGAAVEVHP